MSAVVIIVGFARRRLGLGGIPMPLLLLILFVVTLLVMLLCVLLVPWLLPF